MKYGSEGKKAYLSAILDLKGRDIVSFAIGKSNNNQLVFETFDLAIQKYPDAHPLFHSDRGFQYISKVFKAKRDKQKMTHSMSRVGRYIDNGPMEGFWGILKCEMYYLNHFETYEELVAAVENSSITTTTNGVNTSSIVCRKLLTAAYWRLPKRKPGPHF